MYTIAGTIYPILISTLALSISDPINQSYLPSDPNPCCTLINEKGGPGGPFGSSFPYISLEATSEHTPSYGGSVSSWPKPKPWRMHFSAFPQFLQECWYRSTGTALPCTDNYPLRAPYISHGLHEF